MEAESCRLKEVVGPAGTDRSERHLEQENTLSPPNRARRGANEAGAPRYMSPKRNNEALAARDIKHNESKVQARL
jgi:hypothetical protein